MPHFYFRHQIWGICILITSLLACQSTSPSSTEPIDRFAHIEDPQARSLLANSIEAMGGLERWQGKKALLFTKKYALLFENGAQESAAIQRHHYHYSPTKKIEISWEQGDNAHVLTYSDHQAQKTIDGLTDSSANHQALLNTVRSAEYVMSIPFKLLDPGVSLSYLGKDTLESGAVVEVLQAVFDPDTHQAHSSPDTWQLYFDANTYVLLAYMVQHADHYSYVRNLSDTLVAGFRFVKERESYRVDSSRKILYLRATYQYSDYEMAF